MKHIRFKNFMTLSLLVLIFSSFTTCVENPETKLLGCWTHSIEENAASSVSNIFRPCDFKEFSPSRFRFSFELMKAGKCQILMVGSTDAHYMANGTWEFDKKTNILEFFNAEGNSHRKYEVIKFGENLLDLKPQ